MTRLTNSFNNPSQSNRPSRLLRAGIAALMLIGTTRSYGIESISWNFYTGGFNKGGNTTDGIPVTDSATDSDGYVGTVNAALAWSDISVSSRVPATYGQNTSASSRLDLWAHNRPGQSGPITITVTPHVAVRSWYATHTDPGGWGAYSDVSFSLLTSRNGSGMVQQQYHTMLSGSTGISVLTNKMAPSTLNATDGDQITFDMSHSDGAVMNAYLAANAASVAWYTLVVSSNGYLTTAPGLPEGSSIPVLTPSAPQTTAAAFTDASHTQMTVSGIGGPGVAPLPYAVMTTTDLEHWTPCATGNFTLNGSFSFTVPVNPAEPQRYFRVQTPP